MTRHARFVLVTPVLAWPADQGSRRLQLEVARALRAVGPVAWVTRSIGPQRPAREALQREGFLLDLDESFVAQDPLSRAWRRLGIDVTAALRGVPREAVFTATPRVRELADRRRRLWPDAVTVGVYWTTAGAVAGAPRGRRVLIVADVDQRALAEGSALPDSPARQVGAGRRARLARAEREAFLACDRLLCLTVEDEGSAREALAASRADRAALPEVGTWPATIDVPAQPTPARPRLPRSPLRMLVYGHWEAPFNLDGLRWFLHEIWPHLRRGTPPVELRIAGAGLPAALTESARAAGATVLGWVEALGAELEQCDGVAIPLRYAGGLRYRMLEAMAAGRPCVCTTVAARGAGAQPGRHYLQADDVPAWRAALAALADPARAAALAVDAHRFAAETYGPADLPRRVRQALGHVLEPTQPGS